MSKPGRQSKSGAPSKPPTKPQRYVPARSGPPPRKVARVWPYLKAGLTLAAIVYVLVILGRTEPGNELLIRLGWRDPPLTNQPR
jgi:hypothetical protein